ncbi:MAG: RidA family protein [Bacteroidota bacterium]
MEKRQEVYTSGSPWEDQVGYSRVVRIGNIIEVAGTAPLQSDLSSSNAYLQAKSCLKIIQESLKKVGANLEDVVRTRMYVTDISRWKEYGKAHQEFFGDIKPVTSMVEVAALIDPKMLIEIEATAVVTH